MTKRFAAIILLFAVSCGDFGPSPSPTPVPTDRASLIVAARGNRVLGRGTLAVPLTIAFADPSLDVRIAVRGTDERGQTIEAFGRLFVIPAQRP